MDKGNGDSLEPIDLEWELDPTPGAPTPRQNRWSIGWIIAVAVTGVAAVSVTVAVGTSDRETKAATPTTAAPPTPTPAPTFREPRPIDLPAMNEIVDAAPLYEHRFPWGTGAGSVGFTPGSQGAPAGPLAFSADRAGNVAVFDGVNDRLVELRDGSATTAAIDTRGFAATPAVLDARHRLIVSNGSGGLVVFGADGSLLGHHRTVRFPTLAGQSLSRLVVEGPYVFGGNNGVGRLPLLYDDGTGYQPISSGTWEPSPVQVQVARAPGFATIGRASADKPLYSLRAPWQVLTFGATRLQADGTIVAVLVVDQPARPDGTIATGYVMVTIDRLGTFFRLERFPAPNNYMDSGPMFQLEDDYFAVMSDTVNDGVNVAAYAYP